MGTTNGEKSFSKLILPSISNIIMIASGKGGVGKSTIASNLAIALSKTGIETALVDADIYYPSIPVMFNAMEMNVLNRDGRSIKKPLQKYGVKLLSIGFLEENKNTFQWSEKQAAQYLIQLLGETEWGEIDYMIIDLPSNSEVIPITLARRLNISGVILITTPQSVALTDVEKVANMFLDKSIDIPVIGVIENLSYLLSKDSPPKKHYLFGQGGGEILSKQFQIPLLGQIPISQEICESSEFGDPHIHKSSEYVSRVFDNIAAVVKQKTQSFHEFYY